MKTLFAVLLAACFTTSALAAEVDRRERHQEKRIEQGERTGTVTPAEAARLETEQAKIRSEVAADRRQNGGKLTPAERRKINHEQTKASRDIHEAKHN